MRRFAILFILLVLPLFCRAQGVREEMRFQGETREYWLYMPQTPAEGTPLVLMLHGYGGKAEGYYPEFTEYALSQGFAVCCPQGLRDPGKGKTGWNVGYPSQEGWKVDDIAFVKALSRRLQKKYGFTNVFFSGMSNGGEMCYLVAHRCPGEFGAIASLAGLQMEWIYRKYSLGSPVPFIEIHGTADHTSEWEGDPLNNGGWGAYVSVPLAVGNLAANARCTHEVCDTLPLLHPDSNVVVRHDYRGGSVETTLYEVIGGKHSRHTSDADTPRLLIDFFRRHIK